MSADVLATAITSRQSEHVRPTCGSGSARGIYNTSLHVAALILILVLSTLACSFPIAARRFPRLPVPHKMLFLSRHFGTGVLIATAFIHLLPTAFVSLTDPCLPTFWNEDYPAMPGLIAMVSVLLVVGIEMVFATRGAGHMHSNDYNIIKDDSNMVLNSPSSSFTSHALQSCDRLKLKRQIRDSFNVSASEEELETRILGSKEQIDRSHSAAMLHQIAIHDNEGDEFDKCSHEPDLVLDETARLRSRPVNDQDHIDTRLSLHPTSEESHNERKSRPENHEERKMLLQCLLLEAGILFHSVFIGLALSVATGTSFMVLLVAISFHQTFEGFALGSRIAAITTFGSGSPKPWLMALAYGMTTPFGQAIGLIVHNMYDPMSETGLLMVGIMNAISSGLLLFAGLVELLAEDFLSDNSYITLTGTKRLQACAAVVAGSMLMALVGAFA